MSDVFNFIGKIPGAKPLNKRDDKGKNKAPAPPGPPGPNFDPFSSNFGNKRFKHSSNVIFKKGPLKGYLGSVKNRSFIPERCLVEFEWMNATRQMLIHKSRIRFRIRKSNGQIDNDRGYVSVRRASLPDLNDKHPFDGEQSREEILAGFYSDPLGTGTGSASASATIERSPKRSKLKRRNDSQAGISSRVDMDIDPAGPSAPETIEIRVKILERYPPRMTVFVNATEQLVQKVSPDDIFYMDALLRSGNYFEVDKVRHDNTMIGLERLENQQKTQEKREITMEDVVRFGSGFEIFNNQEPPLDVANNEDGDEASGTVLVSAANDEGDDVEGDDDEGNDDEGNDVEGDDDEGDDDKGDDDEGDDDEGDDVAKVSFQDTQRTTVVTETNTEYENKIKQVFKIIGVSNYEFDVGAIHADMEFVESSMRNKGKGKENDWFTKDAKFIIAGLVFLKLIQYGYRHVLSGINKDIFVGYTRKLLLGKFFEKQMVSQTFFLKSGWSNAVQVADNVTDLLNRPKIQKNMYEELLVIAFKNVVAYLQSLWGLNLQNIDIHDTKRGNFDIKSGLVKLGRQDKNYDAPTHVSIMDYVRNEYQLRNPEHMKAANTKRLDMELNHELAYHARDYERKQALVKDASRQNIKKAQHQLDKLTGVADLQLEYEDKLKTILKNERNLKTKSNTKRRKEIQEIKDEFGVLPEELKKRINKVEMEAVVRAQQYERDAREEAAAALDAHETRVRELTDGQTSIEYVEAKALLDETVRHAEIEEAEQLAALKQTFDTEIEQIKESNRQKRRAEEEKGTRVGDLDFEGRDEFNYQKKLAKYQKLIEMGEPAMMPERRKRGRVQIYSSGKKKDTSLVPSTATKITWNSLLFMPSYAAALEQLKEKYNSARNDETHKAYKYVHDNLGQAPFEKKKMEHKLELLRSTWNELLSDLSRHKVVKNELDAKIEAAPDAAAKELYQYVRELLFQGVDYNPNAPSVISSRVSFEERKLELLNSTWNQFLNDLVLQYEKHIGEIESKKIKIEVATNHRKAMRALEGLSLAPAVETPGAFDLHQSTSTVVSDNSSNSDIALPRIL